MDIRELRKLSDEKLLDELDDHKEALFNLRFQKAFGQLEDVSAIRRTRLIIAQIKTVIRERQLDAQKEKNNA
jgi:large subunit ribosomal protein L29